MGADASTDAVATTALTDNTDTVSDAVADASVSDDAQPVATQLVEADSEEVSEAAEAVKQAANEVEATTPDGE